MADTQKIEFDQRLHQIERSHRKLERGYKVQLRDDGLIVAKPCRKSSRCVTKSLFAILFVLMGFKIFLFAQIGSQAYGERVAELQKGSVAQQLGAYVMYPDPLTVMLATKFGGAL